MIIVLKLQHDKNDHCQLKKSHCQPHGVQCELKQRTEAGGGEVLQYSQGCWRADLT